MKRTIIVVNSTRRTAADDLTCADGEVDRFYGVPWLEEEEDEKKSTASKEKRCVFSPEIAEAGISLPAAARLLTFHSPESSDGERKFAIYAVPGGGVGYADMSGVEPGVSVGPLPAGFGEAEQAFGWSDLVVLKCYSGVAWLLYEGNGVYRLLSALPEAPVVDFALDAAFLEGYTRMAGALPEMDVEVDLHDVPELIDADAITSWLGEGHGNRVDEVVKRRVYEAVAKRVALYMDDVSVGGLFLSPVACISSFGGALPTTTVAADSAYSPPYAKLLSWSLDSVTISMRIQFSLAPKQLSATFSLTTLQKRWRSIFHSLDFGTGEIVKWWIPSPADKSGRPVVNGFNSLSQASGGGFAFRFRSRSRASLLAEVQGVSAFRKNSSVDLSDVDAGTLILSPHCDDAPEYQPDYTDFAPVDAEGSALTDEGVLLWNDRTFFTPIGDNGVVYRYRNTVCDSSILAVTQGSARKSGSEGNRHSLFVFCSDGVRQLETGDGNGYRSSRIVSRVPMLQPEEEINGRLLAHVPSGIVYLSDRGVELLSYSGSVKSLCRYPEGLEPGDIAGLYYNHPASVLILTMADGTLRLFDMEDTEWVTGSFSAEGLNQDIVSLPSGISFIDSEGELSELKIVRRPVYADTTEEPDKWVGTQIPGRCGLVTRPMKFGDPFRRKRICSVDFAVPVDFAIEGSDDLEQWHELATGISSRKSLHTVAYRFLRLRILADSQLSLLIRRIRLSVQYLP